MYFWTSVIVIYMAQNVLKFIFSCTFSLYIFRLNFPEFLHELISTDFLEFLIICQVCLCKIFDTFLPVEISQHKKVLFPRVSQIKHKIEKLNVLFVNGKHNNWYWNFEHAHCYTVFIIQCRTQMYYCIIELVWAQIF